MNFIIISIFLAFALTIFWTIMILFNSSDIIIEVQDQNNGNRIFVYKGKIKIEGKTNVEKIHIRNKAKDQIPLWRDYFIYNQKGKPKIRIFRDSNGDYHPIKTVYDHAEETFKELVDMKNMKFWYTNEIREANEKYKKKESLWNKAAPVIGLIVAGLVFFFSLYYSNDTMNKATAINAQYLADTHDIRIKELNVTEQGIKVIKDVTPVLDNLNKKGYSGTVQG